MSNELPDSFVTYQHGVRGYFAVLMVYDEDMHVPFNTGAESWRTPEFAEADARQWAEVEEIPYISPMRI